MTRRTRINGTPATQDKVLNAWITQVTDALNQLPNMSISSVSASPESVITADYGVLLWNVNSSATTKLWFKRSGTTTGDWFGIA